MIGPEGIAMEQLALHVDVHHEEGSYWAEVRELPGCFAAGDTVAELIESVEEAVAVRECLAVQQHYFVRLRTMQKGAGVPP